MFAFCSPDSKEQRTMANPLPEPPLTIDTTPAPARGWTPALKAKFLDRLAAHGNARAACRNVGLSHESAHRLRRRDHDFARGWAAAILLARENGVQVLAERAIEGIEEDVWYRGELRGTRRRYDTRLLLAHLVRLDRLAANDDATAVHDAARFDELLACIAGEQPPGDVAGWDGLLPPSREAHADRAAEDAEEAVAGAWAADTGKPIDRLGKARHAEFRAARDAAAGEARAAAETEWDGWFARACGIADAHAGWPDATPLAGLPGNPLPLARPAEAPGEGRAFLSPRTVSHASTSALARALAGSARDWPGVDPARHKRRSLRRTAIDLPTAAA
jgi:hypothetical protein